MGCATGEKRIAQKGPLSPEGEVRASLLFLEVEEVAEPLQDGLERNHFPWDVHRPLGILRVNGTEPAGCLDQPVEPAGGAPQDGQVVGIQERFPLRILSCMKLIW